MTNGLSMARILGKLYWSFYMLEYISVRPHSVNGVEEEKEENTDYR